MAQKEYHQQSISCQCGERGEVTLWEWENPVHHSGDFGSYYDSHTGKFTHEAGKRLKCSKCGEEVRAG